MSSEARTFPPSALGTAAAEQDAGNRAELGLGNAPRDGATARLSMAPRTITAGPPRLAQDPVAAVGLTADAGDARKDALLSSVGGAHGQALAVIPVPPTPPQRFQVLQEWEGTVIERRADAIRVRLVDKTSAGPEEEAEIRLEEISGQDRGLVKPGAVFYWSIGYHDSQTGQRSRQSIVVFRRLPAWTAREIADIKSKVRAQKALFGWT